MTDREQFFGLPQAERDLLGFAMWQYQSRMSTHAAGCWEWGQRHHACALTEIARLNLRLETYPSGIDGIAARDVTIREMEKEIAQLHAERLARQEPEMRKVFVCKACQGVYADAPVSSCDCFPDVNEFDEGFIVMSRPAGWRLVPDVASEAMLRAADAAHKERDMHPARVAYAGIYGAMVLAAHAQQEPAPWAAMREMIVCPTCGNKRCPAAVGSDYVCTGSNAVGQIPVKSDGAA